VVKKKLCGRF